MTGCIIFEGYKIRGRYGHRRYRGRMMLAHRVAWIEAHGEIPKGMYVCHHCDNPPCINIDHLFLGTQSDNMNDAVAKGRHQRLRGERHGRHKLTWEQVREIRTSSDTERALARQYSVSNSTIHDIRTGTTWKEGAP